jgi:hypothetical protein
MYAGFCPRENLISSLGTYSYGYTRLPQVYARRLFKQVKTIYNCVTVIFPFTKGFFRWYNPHLFDADAERFLARFAKAAIQEREHDPSASSKHLDFLQLMLNAHTDSSDQDDSTEGWTTDLSKRKHKGIVWKYERAVI